jgi:hypothetical protein
MKQQRTTWTQAKGKEEWQATIVDTLGQVWEATISRNASGGARHNMFGATVACQIAGRMYSNSICPTLAEAQTWCATALTST